MKKSINSDKKIYTIDICGKKIDLPVIPVSNTTSIAFFNLHGDIDLVEHCSRHLAKLIDSSIQILLTAESKGITLTHSLAKSLNHKKFALARKSKKIYIDDGISESVKTISTLETQSLYLSKDDVELLRGKNIAIVDDVISTGNSILALSNLIKKADGNLVQTLAVLAEGDAKNRKDIITLANIPIFVQ